MEIMFSRQPKTCIFKKQLDAVSGSKLLINGTHNDSVLPRLCSSVASELMECCSIRLFNDGMIRSYQKTVDVIPGHKAHVVWHMVPILIAMASVFAIQICRKLLAHRWKISDDSTQLQSNISHFANGNGRKYGAI